MTETWRTQVPEPYRGLATAVALKRKSFAQAASELEAKGYCTPEEQCRLKRYVDRYVNDLGKSPVAVVVIIVPPYNRGQSVWPFSPRSHP